jgi:hypothetical protein
VGIAGVLALAESLKNSLKKYLHPKMTIINLFNEKLKKYLILVIIYYIIA